MLRGELYLRRLHLIQTPWFAIMLHWIVKPDLQPDMHDHPVSFLSIPLRGGYIEEIPFSGHVRQWRWISSRRWNYKRATDRHRIPGTAPGGCLTLVFAGPVVRSWGFHTPKGWVPWREYQQ